MSIQTSPARRSRPIKTPMRSAMKGTNSKNGFTASRLTFVSTPMVREYFEDAPVCWSVDLRENLKFSPSAMESKELVQELEVRDVDEDPGKMTPREKAVKVETLWREEIEKELTGYDFPPPSSSMSREQLVARLNLIKRLMSRANLYVLRGVLVTDYTNKQLQNQLLHYREAVHGVNACSTRAQYEDRLVAALLKDSTGKSGNGQALGFDHGLRFMTVDEQLKAMEMDDECDDERLLAELEHRGVEDIPETFEEQKSKLIEVIREEHEELLESAVEMVVENELRARKLPYTKTDMVNWIKNKIKGQKTGRRIGRNVKGKNKRHSTKKSIDAVAEASTGKSRKRGRNDSRNSVDDNNNSALSLATPTKKRRKVEVISSPSADLNRGNSGSGGNEVSTLRCGNHSRGTNVTQKSSRTIQFPSVENWGKLTDKQLQLELLLAHFDDREISFDVTWNDIPSYHNFTTASTAGGNGNNVGGGDGGIPTTGESKLSSKQVVIDLIREKMDEGEKNGNDGDDKQQPWCTMM